MLYRHPVREQSRMFSILMSSLGVCIVFRSLLRRSSMHSLPEVNGTFLSRIHSQIRFFVVIFRIASIQLVIFIAFVEIKWFPHGWFDFLMFGFYFYWIILVAYVAIFAVSLVSRFVYVVNYIIIFLNSTKLHFGILPLFYIWYLFWCTLALVSIDGHSDIYVKLRSIVEHDLKHDGFSAQKVNGDWLFEWYWDQGWDIPWSQSIKIQYVKSICLPSATRAHSLGSVCIAYMSTHLQLLIHVEHYSQLNANEYPMTQTVIPYLGLIRKGPLLIHSEIWVGTTGFLLADVICERVSKRSEMINIVCFKRFYIIYKNTILW